MGLLGKVGKKCRRGFTIEVLRSNAGYYVGTVDPDEGPRCRLSACYGTTCDDKRMDCERFCDENDYCNGGLGCGGYR